MTPALTEQWKNQPMKAWMQWLKQFWQRWREPPMTIVLAEPTITAYGTFHGKEVPTTVPEPPIELVTPVAEPEPEPPPKTNGRRKHKPHKEHDFTYHHLRKDLAERVDAVLNRFERLPKAGYEYREEDMHNLEDLWGCDFLLFDKELGERMKGGDKWGIIDGVPADEMLEAVGSIDHGFAVYSDDDVLMLWRVMSRTAKDVRGKGLRLVYPKMLRVVMGKFGPHGWTAVDVYLGVVNKQLVVISDHGKTSVADRRMMTSNVEGFLAAVLTAEYEWHVAFGNIPGGPRVLLPTNPSGCLQLFRNRDLDPGQTRRAMLRHWVEEHWRDKEEGLAYVCHHLRGHTKFNWSDLACELFVSRYDLQKNEMFKKQASQWRSHRQHNRVRVHLKRSH